MQVGQFERRTNQGMMKRNTALQDELDKEKRDHELTHTIRTKVGWLDGWLDGWVGVVSGLVDGSFVCWLVGWLAGCSVTTAARHGVLIMFVLLLVVVDLLCAFIQAEEELELQRKDAARERELRLLGMHRHRLVVREDAQKIKELQHLPKALQQTQKTLAAVKDTNTVLATAIGVEKGVQVCGCSVGVAWRGVAWRRLGVVELVITNVCCRRH